MRPSHFFAGLALPVLLLSTTLSRAEETPDLAAQEKTADAVKALPANLGLGLRELVQDVEAHGDVAQADEAEDQHIQRDHRRRVLVNISLDGSKSMAAVRAQIIDAGGEVTAAIPWYRRGVVSAWIPVGQAKKLARQPGLRAIRLAPRARTHVGVTTSQGATVHKTTDVNTSGYTGTGITVGVISDSYDADTADRSSSHFTRAADDVLSGDLPGLGNPAGQLTPVQVVKEASASSFNSDEGRGMLQIVHDLAPASHLAFSTSGETQAEFAQNILDLRAQSSCQIMVDDIGFADEPIFSDGMIAQSVNQVAAAGVHYFASAGNDGNSGYAGTFTPIPLADAKPRLKALGINFASVPPSIRKQIESFHSFGTDAQSQPIVVQKVRANGRTFLGFQWDDPFDAEGVTTDFDILVFSASGQFLLGRSGGDDNFQTDQPIEFAYLKSKTNYKICIIRSTNVKTGVTPAATHLQYVGGGGTPISGDFITPSSPSTFGHSDAAGGSGVAAYNYDVSPPAPDATGPHPFTPGVEDFSSNGPITIYFDSDGQRLVTPDFRQQPIFSAVDNVNTSFFPPGPLSSTDTDNDDFPNFSGTSAAAPHAAAIAALVLNASAANTITAPTPAQMRTLLSESTQGLTDQDPSFCAATAGPVTISAAGENPESKDTFTITFNGVAGQELTALTIDLTPTSVHFDPAKKLGFPFTLGKRTGSTQAMLVGKPIFSGGNSDHEILTVNFKKFVSGDTLNFGIDRDNDISNMYGNGADLLAGATISLTVDGTVYTGTFANVLSKAYNFKAGFGLLDAQAAVDQLLSN